MPGEGGALLKRSIPYPLKKMTPDYVTGRLNSRSTRDPLNSQLFIKSRCVTLFLENNCRGCVFNGLHSLVGLERSMRLGGGLVQKGSGEVWPSDVTACTVYQTCSRDSLDLGDTSVKCVCPIKLVRDHELSGAIDESE
jgi:hypothetical protein